MKRSKGMSRHELLSELAERLSIISVHEHLGEETLQQEGGFNPTYRQNVSDFATSAPSSVRSRFGHISNDFAAVFLSMPLYVQYHEASVPPPHRGPEGVYFNLNRALLAACREQQDAYYAQGRSSVLPIPFMSIDPMLSASSFEAVYQDVWPYVAGLKWHPFARQVPLQRYVDSGYLELAARYSLPTVIHCARTGVEGNFRDVIDIVADHACNVGAVVDVAHAGFIHDDLTHIREFEFLYFDIAPWHVIYSGRPESKAQLSSQELLSILLEEYEDRVLFGLDTPWNKLLWSANVTIGADVEADIGVLSAALAGSQSDCSLKILHANPLRFLHGTPARPSA